VTSQKTLELRGEGSGFQIQTKRSRRRRQPSSHSEFTPFQSTGSTSRIQYQSFRARMMKTAWVTRR